MHQNQMTGFYISNLLVFRNTADKVDWLGFSAGTPMPMVSVRKWNMYDDFSTLLQSERPL